MYHRAKKIQVLFLIFVIVPFFLLPFSLSPADDNTNYEDTQSPLSLSVTDTHINLVDARKNVSLSPVEDITLQDGRNGRRAPEIKRMSYPTLFYGFLYDQKTILNSSKLTDILSICTFERHVIIPHSIHAPPQI